jgi:hypothetical protein
MMKRLDWALASTLMLVCVSQNVAFAQGDDAQLAQLEFRLPVPRLALRSTPAGTQLQMNQHHASGRAGDPQLLARSVRLALPPGAIPSTIKVRVKSLRSETLAVERLAPVAQEYQGLQVVERKDVRLVQGRNPRVYGRDIDYPDHWTSGFKIIRDRGCLLLSVRLTPVRYNDLQRQLRVSLEFAVSVTYQERPLALEAPGRPAIRGKRQTLQQVVAENGCQRWEEIERWYDLTPAPHGGQMRLVAAITDSEIVRRILSHLGSTLRAQKIESRAPE